MANDVPRYLASLPERSTRALAAAAGGVVRETTDLILPAVVRKSRLYQATVARLLRIVIELVGDVRGVYPPDLMPAGELAVRKTAGNVVELAGLVAVGWSPLWLLAAASDLLGGSKTYLKALVAQLEEERALPPDSDVASYDDLLTRLETASGTLADTIDIPPMTLRDARESFDRLRQQAENLPPADTLGTIFAQIQMMAEQEGRSPAELSAVLGLAAARTGIELGNAHIFAYYQDAMTAIGREGLVQFLRRIATPYAKRVGDHFLPGTPTYTGRFFDWIGDRRRGDEPAEPPSAATPTAVEAGPKGPRSAVPALDAALTASHGRSPGEVGVDETFSSPATSTAAGPTTEVVDPNAAGRGGSGA